MNDFPDKEFIYNKKRKLEKGKEKEKENYNNSDLTIKNPIHKLPSSLIRKKISESEFNFNVSPSKAFPTSWELPENDTLSNTHYINTTYKPSSSKIRESIEEIDLVDINDNDNFNENNNENETGKILINEPEDIPIIEEFDEQNENYPYLNSQTLQYEFTSEGIKRDNSYSNLYFNNINTNKNINSNVNPNANSNNSFLPPLPPGSGENHSPINRQESSLVPFKRGSQVILYNNNSTGQVVLYNKTNKSLSIHKVRPDTKDIISRNKRCILCNQLLPSERERMNTDNMFKNTHTYNDAKYFRLLACSLSYSKKPSLTGTSNNTTTTNNNNNNNNESDESNDTPSIYSVNSAENIINLLNDNSNRNAKYLNAHPAITITNSRKDLRNNDKEDNLMKNGEKKDNLMENIINTNTASNNNNNNNAINNDQNNNSNNNNAINNNQNNNNDNNNNNESGDGSTTYLSSSSFNNGYYERFFIERKKLGRGFRGSVFLCHHVLDQVFLGEYAIKKVAVGNNHQWLVRMLKEVMLLEKLRNPNIIEYKHAWLEEHTFSLFGPKVPCLFILMERANGGNLEEYVQLQWSPEDQFEKVLSVKERIKRKRLQMKAAQNQIRDNRAQFFGGIGYDSFGKRVRYLTTEAIWKIFLDICYGLNHLHELGIIHRDLKPPNLLLQYKDPNNQEEIPKVLISDFGECEILSHIEKRQRTGATGTLEFMAELLISDETGHYYDDYSSNSDLWSLGVVLYYICFSEMPYSQVDDIDILKNEILNLTTVQFKNDNNSNRVPKELKSLIKKLMVKIPTKRPKAKEILDLYGGYKDNIPIKISTNDDAMSRNSSNLSSASSSTRNISINEAISINDLTKKLEKGKSPLYNSNNNDDNDDNNSNNNNNNNNNNNQYLSPPPNSKINISNNIINNNNNNNNKEENKVKNNNININDSINIINDNKTNNNNSNNDNNNEKKVNEIENKESNENENKNKNEDENENENENTIEWLDKEFVDEPLTFKAEKRIVPFNHGRSKSFPYLPNTSLKDYQKQLEENYSEIQKDNIILEEETATTTTTTAAPIANPLTKEEEILINESESYKFEKSLVPFHESKYHDRPLPSPTYPPLKNNDKEYMTLTTSNIRKRKNNMNTMNHMNNNTNNISSNKELKKYHNNKENWIEDEDYLKEIARNQLRKFSKHHTKEEKTEELLDSIKQIINENISVSKLHIIWNIIKRQSNIETFFSELYQLFISNIKDEKYSNKNKMKNNNKNKNKNNSTSDQKRSRKGNNRNNHKIYSSSSSISPVRHKYQNSKIYFLRHHQLNKDKNINQNKIENRKRNRNNYRNRNKYNNSNDNNKNYLELYGKTIEVNNDNDDNDNNNNNNKQITNYNPLLSSSSSSSSLLSLTPLSALPSSKTKKEEKIIKFLKQKFILLNIIVFLIKAFILYHILYPHLLNVFTVIRYSIADFVFLYLLKLIYKGIK
ncbi:hypothetical protein BCR32DRAFT_284819 [Anaeromyces robustus]|uniref:non-specific serine/threonine protein kinase n=1 Tax=Anaeromyces robustus TaxID=1754192 RepID=A0A1Y1WQL4_9FUNG|nr:hypothetical protein BCR32DRAFT_284819 [Anaeromyces robustus]|eukprot:ORX75827.1 hypothetical protein BCR32DRAFT_284819 [Anaeromyces robustus]